MVLDWNLTTMGSSKKRGTTRARRHRALRAPRRGAARLDGIRRRAGKPRRRLHREHPGHSDRAQADAITFRFTHEVNRLIHVQGTSGTEFKTTESIHMIERQ